MSVKSKKLARTAVLTVSLFSALAFVFGAAEGKTDKGPGDGNDASAYERRIPGHSYEGRELLVTGQYITPLAAPGSRYQTLATGLRPDGNADADGAYTTALSPDGKTLLVLTNGYNANDRTTTGEPIKFPYMDPLTGEESDTFNAQTQWIFIYDIWSDKPVKKQRISIPSALYGIAWAPDGNRFYVSGGQEDRVYIFKKGAEEWEPDAPFILLGHNSDGEKPKPKYDGGIFKNTPAGQSKDGQLYGLNFGAVTAGVAVSADGKEVYAVNMQNDSVSIIDADSRKVKKEIALFTPGSTEPQGAYPMWVTPFPGKDGKSEKIYVTSVRDGQVISISLPDGKIKAIDVQGAPTKMLLSPDQSKLFVVNPDLDEVIEINTKDDAVTRRISVQEDGFKYRGSNPNSLDLSKNNATLYVTLGGENAIAVINLNNGKVIGRIPTAWYPTSVTLSQDNEKLYVVNFKSTAGPAPGGGGFTTPMTPYQKEVNPTFQNQHVMGTLKSAIVSMPIPDAETLAQLSEQVQANNHFNDPRRREVTPMMKFLREHIKHVIYIQKENRSYDQILGDLEVGNGDPRLTLFPYDITPNHHKLALDFVCLDNFYVPNESSGDGWAWMSQGRGNEYITVGHQFNDGSGLQMLDFASMLGVPRQQNVALPIKSDKMDLLSVRSSTYFDPSGRSTILPGSRSPAVTWGADDHSPDATGGYIWDSVIRAGLTVRHYGLRTDAYPYYQFSGDFTNSFYLNGKPITPGLIPVVRDAFEKKVPQAVSAAPGLAPYTDIYYRGWDLNTPDQYRYEEWKREFDEYVKNGDMPNFIPMLLPMDHTGNFEGSNVAGLHTPELQMADNDHAIGQLVSAVSKSPYWKNTLIIILEDDAYDGPDHVQGHRIPAYMISPYVKRNAVVSKFYNTASVVRTMADILGFEYLGYNDALSESMDEVFTTEPNFEPYEYIIPGNLLDLPVDLVPDRNNPKVKKTKAVKLSRGQSWWAENTKGMNFDDPDAEDTAIYNRVLWRGLKGDDVPFPEGPTGEDLSLNRQELLERWSEASSASN